MARFFDPAVASSANADLPDMGDKTGGLLQDVTGIPSSQITPDVAANAGELTLRDAAGVPAEVSQDPNPQPADLVHKISAQLHDLARVKSNVADMVRQGAPESEIDTYIKSEGTTPEAIKALDQKSIGKYIDDIGRSLALGMTFGFADKMAAGLDTLVRGGTYEENLQKQRAQSADISPAIKIPGEVVGAVASSVAASPVTAGLSAITGAAKLPGIVRAAGSGAGIGAATAAGQSDNVTPGEVAGGAALGAAGGAILHPVISTVQAAVNPIVERVVGGVKPAAPLTSELKAQAQNLYKTADSAGIRIGAEPFRNMVGQIVTDAKRQGFDKDIQPKAAAALRRLQAEIEDGASPTLSEFDTLRQVAGAAARSPDSNDRRVARIITSKMDEFMSKVTPNDLAEGANPSEAVSALTGARKLWAQYIKSDQIDQLFEKAANNAGNMSASGYENALRNQFRALANNPNRMRQFSTDEQQAIKDVVRGDLTQNTMTKLGRFSPNAGFFSALVSGEIAVHAVDNPKLLAIPAIGAIARYFGRKQREAAANKVSEMVRGGPDMASYLNKLGGVPAAQSTLGAGIRRGGLTLGAPIFGQNNQ